MGTKVQHRREYAPIPRLLRRMRESAGLTQQAFADRLKWFQSAVQKSEAGDRRVDFGEFVMWAKACGADPRDMLDQYLEAVYPGETMKARPGIKWPWEAQENTETTEELAALLAKASSLVKPKPRKRKPKAG